jgi:hypothetical protein
MIEHAFDILVIVLSVALFILLIIAIVASIFIIKLVKSLRHIADRGVLIVDKAEETVDTIRQSASVAGVANALGSIAALFRKSKKGE